MLYVLKATSASIIVFDQTRRCTFHYIQGATNTSIFQNKKCYCGVFLGPCGKTSRPRIDLSIFVNAYEMMGKGN